MTWEWIFLASAVPLWLLGTVYAGWLETRFPSRVESKGGQIEVLEILRGIAAFVVFCAHVTAYFRVLAPGSRASSYLGDLGVIIFFMLTGYLFWGQILSGRLALDSFLQKRIRRLVPLGVAVIGTVTLLDWVQSGFVWPTLKQLQDGARNFGFGFVPVQDVFTPEMYLRINTIWSLRWEWLFYLCLPLFAVKRNHWAMTGLAAMMFVLFFNVRDLWTSVETEGCFIIAFYLGALGCQLGPNGPLYSRLSQRSRVMLAATLFLAFVSGTILRYFVEGAPEARVRHLVFVLIASLLFFTFPLVADVKRLTSSWLGKAAMHMGRISYSVYLWQLVIIYYVIHRSLSGVDINTAGWFYGSIVFLTFAVVTVSHFSFRHIEVPFIQGRSWLDKRRPAGAS